MISMFIIAAGLNRTQMVSHLSKMVYRVSKGSFTKVLAGYMAGHYDCYPSGEPESRHLTETAP